MTFTEQLSAAWQRNDSLLCVGLDPDPAKLPLSPTSTGGAIFAFCREIVDATADLARAFCRRSPISIRSAPRTSSNN